MALRGIVLTTSLAIVSMFVAVGCSGLTMAHRYVGPANGVTITAWPNGMSPYGGSTVVLKKTITDRIRLERLIKAINLLEPFPPGSSWSCSPDKGQEMTLDFNETDGKAIVVQVNWACVGVKVGNVGLYDPARSVWDLGLNLVGYRGTAS